MIEPTYEEINQLAQIGKYKTAPMSLEILSDSITPIQLLMKLKNISKHCYILESISGNEQWGRYTYLGYDPKLEISCLNGKMKIGDLSFETNEPGKYIKKIMDEHRSVKFEGLPTFTGGLVGYFAYDYIKYSERTLNLDAIDSEGFQDVDLMLFDKVIAFDNFKQKIILLVNISMENVETEYIRGKQELAKLEEIITSGIPQKSTPGKLKSELKALFTEEEYCHMVNQAKHYIKEGDIFQIVLSNRMEAEFEGSLLGTYRILRTLNPSPYMFYFSSSDMEVAGASPETLVKLENGVLHTFPLAGTRPRGSTRKEDTEYEEELLKDEKELAEHNMLVDLGRNDIGKISKFGSVSVEKYHAIERFSHVMHIGSTVKGIIADDKSAIDAIDAILPAGTLSGAPKIKACQLINNLEHTKRGIYGGAIGYLDFAGNLDMCIAIRIAYKRNGKVFVRSGAGIVADSIPQSEYIECTNKAAAVVKALMKAQEDIL